MKSAGLILLDLFLDLIVYSNFLAVFSLLYALSFSILTGYFSGNGNGIIVVSLFNCQSDQTFCDLTYFLSLCFGRNDLASVKQSCNLVAKQSLSLIRCSA